MLLKILTWNINFVHDDWFNRIHIINDILKANINNVDIIALQEATLPFSKKLSEMYTFLLKSNMNAFDSGLFERTFLYKYICKLFPLSKKKVSLCFDYIMNKILYICAYIYSYWGEYLKYLYFKCPIFVMFICILVLPLFVAGCYFLGMITILNKKINYSKVSSKYIGCRRIQYSIFKYNNKEVLFVNVHLIPGKEKKIKERIREIKKLVKFCKKYKNVILAGDFNDVPNGKIYKYLIKKKYKNVMSELHGNNVNTFPSNNPIECVDFIWVKGDICIKDAEIFGDEKASDHFGIRATLDI